MKGYKIGLLCIIVMTVFGLGLTGCRKEYSTDNVKDDIEQIVRDVYTPKSMKAFKDSYHKYIENGLLTKEAADSIYKINSDNAELTEEDLARTCYVDVAYSNRDDNSDNKSHYFARLQLYGANNTSATANILFYVKDGIDEEKETIISAIVVTDVETSDDE